MKVLAVGSETAATATGGNGQPSATAAQSGLVTFQVPPDQALRIVQDNKAGSLYLVLEPLTGTGSGTAIPATGH